MTLRSLVLAATLALLAGHSAVAYAHGSSSGKCAKVKCVASDACHRAGTCDPATGACSNPVAPDGGSCSDKNGCTEKDVCRAGTCVGTPKKNGSSCDDRNSCTEKDACQAGSCVGGRSVKNGTSCSDGNGCTEKDACQAGVCTGKLKKNGSSCDDKNPCTGKDVCTAGACAGTNKRDGSECELDDDDNECISEDGTCRAGVCKPDKAKTCAAPDQCHVGLCDPETGGCFSRDAAPGAACNDDNPCTSPDRCENGVCTGTLGCDDDNRCTLDSCESSSGCLHTPISCDDDNQCTIDSCDRELGCVYLVLSCDDGNACTTDSCEGPQGCINSPISCDDGNACTIDSCDPTSGCTNMPVADGMTCDDGDDCTPTDTCEAGVCRACIPTGTCTAPPCDDEEGFCPGVVCAFDDDCPAGETCVAGSAPSPRFVDNGDGTVTDRQTCLVWEQKNGVEGTTPGGGNLDFTNPNDVDNSYQWSSTGTAMDGGAFTDFLLKLNSGTGFAGHTDWRLPTSTGSNTDPTGKRAELESIVDASATGCGIGGACINAEFGPTAATLYWSLSNGASSGDAWYVDFSSGDVNDASKGNELFVRAVRGGVIDPCGDGVVCGSEECDPPGEPECGVGSACDATCQCVTITTTTTVAPSTTTTTTTLPACGAAGANFACRCTDGSTRGTGCGSAIFTCAQARNIGRNLCIVGGGGPGDCATAPCSDCTTRLPCQ